jgi:UDP-glucose 4-epimerase
MPTYLVTGAAGFIGSAVARRLVEHGHRVVTIDNLSTGFRENIPSGVEFVRGDCQDDWLISSLRAFRFDAILHIAGQSSGEISFDDPIYDLQANTQSTLLLLKFARETGCRKFVYAGSMSVYGDQPDRPVSEEAHTQPKSFYGAGKLASEHYMRIFQQQHGVQTTALRLFNVYGPGQNLENLRQGMVSIFLAQALRDGRIVVKGSPERYRDFVYIDDVVEAFCLATERSSSGFSVFNVATGVRTTVSALLELIQDFLPEPAPVEYTGSTPGDQFGMYADISKIQRELNWQPSVGLSAGLKKMVAAAIEQESPALEFA